MTTFVVILVGILLFGLLIAVHELGHFFTAKLCGVRVNEFSIGMGPKLWSRQGEETLYSLRLFPIGGFCAMEGEDEDTQDPRSFQKAAVWKKLLILAAGAFMNFVIGVVLFILLTTAAGGYNTPVITGFLEGYTPPAGQQLQVGDRILSIDGHAVLVSDDISIFFNRGGEDLDLVVERSGKRLELKGYHMPFFSTDEGPKRGVWLGYEPITVWGALSQGWLNGVDTVRIVWMSLGDLLTGAVGIRDLSGPVGVVDMMGDVAAASPSLLVAVLNIVYLIAFIAVNLAVMNLLPIPALDGGRIFFLLVGLIYTAVTRKRMDPKYEGAINTVGFILLLVLMVVVAASDILKLFGR